VRLVGGAIEVTRDLAADDSVAGLIATLPARLNEAEAAFEGASDLRDHPGGGSYAGFTACSTCHSLQHAAWLDSPHPGAFQSLQAIAWHTEPGCFGCHTTGFGYSTGFERRDLGRELATVGCEACHGPGAGEAHDAPGYGATDEATCLACHTEEVDPGFAYEEVRHDVRIAPPGRQ